MATKDDHAAPATHAAMESLALFQDHAPPLPALDDFDWSGLFRDHEASSSTEESTATALLETGVALPHQQVDRSTRRRALRANSARQRRALHKTTTDALRIEANALTERLVALRGVTATTTNWYARAIVERHKRELAQRENMQLQHALAAVRTHVVGLNALMSVSFFNTSVNMRDLLHSYTHLTRATRAQDYRAVCTQQKLDAAYQIVTQETSRLYPTTSTTTSFPQIAVQTARVASRPNELAVTTCARITLEISDLGKAFDAAVRVYMACSPFGWASFRPLQGAPRTQEMPARDIRYVVCECQYTSESTGERVLLEERHLTYWNLDATGGVVVRDFVDGDEQYPLKHTVDAKRHSVSGLVVRRELCTDGVERIVCSIVFTKVFEFLPHGKPIVAADTVDAAAIIEADIQSVARLELQAIRETSLAPSDGVEVNLWQRSC